MPTAVSALDALNRALSEKIHSFLAERSHEAFSEDEILRGLGLAPPFFTPHARGGAVFAAVLLDIGLIAIGHEEYERNRARLRIDLVRLAFAGRVSSQRDQFGVLHYHLARPRAIQTTPLALRPS